MFKASKRPKKPGPCSEKARNTSYNPIYSHKNHIIYIYIIPLANIPWVIYNSHLWNDHNPIYSHKWAIKINPDNGFEAFTSGHSKTHWNARRTVPKKTMRWSNVTHGFLMRCKARAEVKDVETPAPNQHQPAHTEHLLHRCKPRNPKPPVMTTFMAQALKNSGTKHLSL